ncbi:MAG: tRNA (N(6)-L-threonylcarbamoyladenosine(37)-C(2))-methylthiotransferase MtaB, partial [Flavobacteriales bacterium]
PNCCIGVDVIILFPGETEEEFQKTYQFLTELDVSYLHVFTYSERANTTALRIDEVVPMEERQKRSKMLRILSAKKKRKFYEDN